MTKRGVLWFKDAHVTDDAGNTSTDVELIKDVTSAQFTALATDGSTEGAYNITDENGIPVDASMIGYDNTQSGLSANNPQDAIDEVNAKITKEYTEIMSKTATGTYTADITGKTEFIYGRKNPAGTLNNYHYAHISMFGLSNGLEIATTGSIVADLTVSGNVLTAVLSTLSSGSFVVFAR